AVAGRTTTAADRAGDLADAHGALACRVSCGRPRCHSLHRADQAGPLVREIALDTERLRPAPVRHGDLRHGRDPLLPPARLDVSQDASRNFSARSVASRSAQFTTPAAACSGRLRVPWPTITARRAGTRSWPHASPAPRAARAPLP